MLLTEMQRKRFLTLRRSLIARDFSKMNEMQRQAVLTTEGPLLILAGAGSGKTTVLIHRIANLLRYGSAYQSNELPDWVDTDDLAALEAAAAGQGNPDESLRRLLSYRIPRPWEIMAITFTNKAAGELRARLTRMLGDQDGNDVAAATFHSTCVRILRSHIQLLGYDSSFAIYDADDSQKLVKEILKSLNLDDKTFPPRSVLAQIGQCKDLLETPADTIARAKALDNFRLSKVAQIYEGYQKRLRAANALDFDDIISLTVRIFSENPEVLAKYQRRYRYVMVDEYQDTNHSQYKLVSMLAGGYHNLCVVGDDDQSIYAFRGATIENILSFEKQFQNAQVIRLEQNYRSTQNILTAANRVISQNLGRKGKTLWTAAGDGQKLSLYTAYDERDEGNAIASAILKLHQEGKSYHDCAVLYRMNAQSQAIESALVAAGIPYKVVGGMRFFDRKEVKDVIAYLSVLNNPSDALRLRRIINEPKRNIGDATMATAMEIAEVVGLDLYTVLSHPEEYAPLQRKISQLSAFTMMMEELRMMAETAALPDLLDALMEKTGYRNLLLAEGIPGQTRLENIEELKTTMGRYVDETDVPTLGGFLEEVALYTDLDSYEADADAVTMMTLHAAKGLEFPCVFLPGMEEGIFPSTRSMADENQLEEERRLAYVGITRAKEQLTILNAQRRMLFGQTLYGRDSRFLRDIPEGLIERTGRTPKETKPAAPRSTASRTAGRLGVGTSLPPASGTAAPKAEPPAWTAGELVSHRVFGEGEILSVKAMGGDQLLEIRFEKVGVKKIMATFARLTKRG